MINNMLKEGGLLATLKETVLKDLLENSFLDLDNVNCYQPEVNIPC